jgi:hypothetical protein
MKLTPPTELSWCLSPPPMVLVEKSFMYEISFLFAQTTSEGGKSDRVAMTTFNGATAAVPLSFSEQISFRVSLRLI